MRIFAHSYRRSIDVSSVLALSVLAVACNEDGPMVSGEPVASVSVSPATATLFTEERLQFTATLLDADGDTLPDREVFWSTSNAQVAGVDQIGLVTAAAEGDAIINATSDGITGKASIEVVMAPELAGFIGYPDPDMKRTVCWDCHPAETAGWIGTTHVQAWGNLQDSSDAQPACEACHSLTELGNAVEGTAGYSLAPDRRYQDVQCESCHGPGRDHVVDPSETQPQAALSAGTTLATGCGECHRLAEQPHTEQWEQSNMGRAPSVAIAAETDPACLECHEGKAALASRFGVDAAFAEKDDGSLLPIVCSVCHDPHGSEYEDDLRAQVAQPTSDFLCLRCHAYRSEPPSASGPHAAQGMLLLGDAGWVPPGWEDQIDGNRTFTTHGPKTNPRLCLTCHVPQFSVNDPTTGRLIFRSVGHTFRAISCLDSRGIPVPGTCPDEERYFDSCANSGCHFTGDFARMGDYGPFQERLNFLLDNLWADSDGNRVIDATDGGLLPQIVARADTFQLVLTDDSVTVAEGALWNAQLAFNWDRTHFGDGEVFGARFSATKVSGNGVHNPFLLEALLQASVGALQTYLQAQQR